MAGVAVCCVDDFRCTDDAARCCDDVRKVCIWLLLVRDLSDWRIGLDGEAAALLLKQLSPYPCDQSVRPEGTTVVYERPNNISEVVSLEQVSQTRLNE